MPGQGLTVAETAKALGLSERTIRRRIKSGKIKADLVVGRYGEEYRIDLDEVAATEERVDKDLSTAIDRSLDKTLDSVLDKALDMVKTLQQEKAELYAQVAYWQGQYRYIEEQVKLLMEAKRPWWRRWMGRG